MLGTGGPSLPVSTPACNNRIPDMEWCRGTSVSSSAAEICPLHWSLYSSMKRSSPEQLGHSPGALGPGSSARMQDFGQGASDQDILRPKRIKPPTFGVCSLGFPSTLRSRRGSRILVREPQSSTFCEQNASSRLWGVLSGFPISIARESRRNP